jgi:glycosyltransferase involved in cell wall biosynthesis
MNLFYTITAYPPSIGGAQSNIHELCRRLKDRHSVRVASFWSSNRTDWLLGTTWNAPGGRPYEIDGVHVTPIDYSTKERLEISPWVLVYYAWQSMSIQKIADSLLPKLREISGKPDLIHHGRVGREPLAFASLKLARELGVPFILTAYHHPRWNGWIHHNYQHLYRQADAIIALTDAERETLVDLGVKQEQVFVVGTGAILSSTYDPSAVRAKYGLDGPVVLFLGQKYRYKRFDHLVKAAPIVWSKHPNTHFLFLGPRTAYSQRIFARSHDPRIIETEAVNLEEKTAALAACDILCLPSTQECFGSVFVEAWKMGKPVIGADIPAVSSVITNGVDGYVVPAEPMYLAKKIIELLDSPTLRKRMGENGLQKAESQYEWSTLSTRLENIYQTVLGIK